MPFINSSTGETIALETRDPIASNIGKNLTVLTLVDVKLQCETTGTPMPSVAWYKDDKKIDGESSNVLIVSDGNIVDGGKYTCTATNVKGEVSEDSYIKFVGEHLFSSLFNALH